MDDLNRKLQKNVIELQAAAIINSVQLKLLTDMIIMLRVKYENGNEEKIREQISKLVHDAANNYIRDCESEPLIDEIQHHLKNL